MNNLIRIFIIILTASALQNCSKNQNTSTDITPWFMGSKPGLYETWREGEKYNGETVYFLKSKQTISEEFGTIMRNINAAEYINKRVKMSGFIKTEEIDSWAGMWMRVDSYEQGKMLGFDNMSTRPIKGTSDWQKYEIVLDVPKGSAGIAFGILLSGNGKMWMAEPTLEVVGIDVASTNMLDEEYLKKADGNPDMPSELKNIPNGIEIGHNPQTVSAVYNEKDSMYYWFYKTSVKPVNEDIEITEFGAYSWVYDHWEFSTVTGKPFEPKDFADWYKCKNAKIIKGKEYSDIDNWNSNCKLPA